MIIIVMMMVIMMITTNDSDNDENNDNDDNNKNDNKLPMGPPHKGPIILSFDVTIVESKNNSRVFGDLRCHVPHVTSLWCDIFTQHRHICIVESSYEWNSSYMSICIQNCVRCNWLWCFGNPAMQSAMDSPHKRPLILHLDVCFVWANLWNNSRVAAVEKRAVSYIYFIMIQVYTQILKLITITTW